MFENFRNKCLEIYELDPVYFVSAPGLAWQVCLKKTEVKLELLTDFDMILMIGKRIRGGICQATHRYAKANNKYMKNYDKNSESSYIEYLDANNLCGWAISQKLPVNGFEWVKEKIYWRLHKKYDEDCNKDIGFKYEPYLCNGCHDLMQKAMSFNNVAIVYVKGNAYRIHFWYMSKDDAIDIMNGSNLVDKRGVL